MKNCALSRLIKYSIQLKATRKKQKADYWLEGQNRLADIKSWIVSWGANKKRNFSLYTLSLANETLTVNNNLEQTLPIIISPSFLLPVKLFPCEFW